MHSLSAGMIAGTATLAMTNPIWVAKTRLCLQYENQQKQYSSLMNTLWNMLKKEGLIRGWYRGFIPGIVGTTHGALNFMMYDDLKKKLEKTKLKGPILHVACAALSKMFAASVTYPYQVVRTRLQDHHVQYTGIKDVIFTTWRLHGLPGFYKGMFACLLRVTPASCITFVVYEEIALFFHSHTIYADVPKTTTGALPPLFPGGTKKIIVKEMGASGGEGGSHKMGRTMNIIILSCIMATVMFLNDDMVYGRAPHGGMRGITPVDLEIH
uniref:Mitochondrial carrier protein n=1 Tax=Romanomermis culicivorax TaxID=13658 RepID=A0A915K346_ROMCU